MKFIFGMMFLVSGAAIASGLTTLESSPDGIVFELSASQPVFKTLAIRGDNYSTVVIEGTENVSEFSYPRMPVYRTWLEIPVGATVEATITDETIRNISGPAWPVNPGILSASKSEPRGNFVMELNDEVYSSGAAYPAEWVRVIYAGQMRGRNLALVEVLPLRWNPIDNSCDLLAEATISLAFEGGDLGATYANASRYYAPPFEQMLSNMTDNYGTFEGGCDTPPAPYLIVGHSDFVTTGMDDFVAWKTSLGFDVTMVDLSVTGTTASDIEDYILDAIENWANPPQYVLLVGDTGYLPGNTATAYGGVTDLYYVTLDDGGYLPDAFIGRFSVTTTAEAILMADRVIDYEQNVSGSTSWVQNTCWIASSDNHTVSEGSHNYCIDTFLTPLGYTADTIYPYSGGTASQAVTSINGGISMLTFSGHGSTTSWGDMSFSQSNFNSLTNSSMLPGVFSHSCVTGNYAVGTCWAETWTRTPGKGGLWFFGSVPSSYWDEDDIQERSEFEWFLSDGVYWAKGFCNGGLIAVYDYYGGSGRSKYYMEGYNLMGDPSVQMAVWGVTGIEEQQGSALSNNTGIMVSNPVRSAAVITLNGNGPAELNVFDLTGRLVATPYRGNLNESHSLNWNARDLAPGMYFLRLEQGGEVSTARVMVIR
ncbi:MAG: T9SS type A sorting domain-containing protein [Candidatus Aegiribacteria sp.]|nr:T9SS type A sorting domain-containing protein [Candidatus Aegiribacteria sp.]